MEEARCDLSPRVLLPHFSLLLIQEHEGSRRMKTELLIQMDGLTASNDQVMNEMPLQAADEGYGAVALFFVFF